MDVKSWTRDLSYSHSEDIVGSADSEDPYMSKLMIVNCQ